MEGDPGSGRRPTPRGSTGLSECLELRVALPGAGPFAFLLTIPFNQRFALLTTAQERIYLATLLITTVSAVLLIAPTAYHRITFRKQKARLVLLANRLAIVRLGFLALAMTGTVLLITDFLQYRAHRRLHDLAGLMFATFGTRCRLAAGHPRGRRSASGPATKILEPIGLQARHFVLEHLGREPRPHRDHSTSATQTSSLVSRGCTNRLATIFSVLA
jgi:hypothetical protein